VREGREELVLAAVGVLDLLVEEAVVEGCGGTSRIISSATITKANEMPFSTYAIPTPLLAMTMPATAGPATDAS